MMNTKTTLAELVTKRPSSAGILQKYGIDFCCGGYRGFDEACHSKGVDPVKLLAEIESYSEKEEEEFRWDERTEHEIIDHILKRYHAPLLDEISRLVTLAEKVEQVHKDKADRPVGLGKHLRNMYQAVESHLAKEEQILFPMIRSGRGNVAHMPIKVMTKEHEDHGEDLRRMRLLTNNLSLPEYACASWRELYGGLEQLEMDLMEHIHIENNILFPRVLAQ